MLKILGNSNIFNKLLLDYSFSQQEKGNFIILFHGQRSICLVVFCLTLKPEY